MANSNRLFAKIITTTLSGVLFSTLATSAVAGGNDSLHKPTTQDRALDHANKLLEKYLIFDGHNDLPFYIREDAVAPKFPQSTMLYV